MRTSLLTAIVALVLCPPVCAQITTFTLTAGATGTLPFTVGVALKKGDAPATINASLSNYQVVVKATWNDGSVKHAIVSGRAPLRSGSPLTVNVTAASSAPGGTDLTCADIQTAAPSASIQAAGIGSVNLALLLGSPFRTWITGPEMVECHYRGAIGSDATLVGWFHVRLYAGGSMFVRAVVENGYLDLPTTDRSYVPAISINGATVYDNKGASLVHRAHTRYMAEAWIGTDPQITVAHNTTYLKATKLVPNYATGSPGGSVLNGLTQTYTPMGIGDWSPSMANSGFQEQIGILPKWDALYITSNGDARAFRSVLANAKSLCSYPIVWRDSKTALMIKPSDRPAWTFNGNNVGGSDTLSFDSGNKNWDLSHHGSGGYLAYLITGDYLYFQILADQASMPYLANTPLNGQSTNRIFQLQTRAVAWSTRTVGQYVGIAPAGDPIAAEYRKLLASQADYWSAKAHSAGQNALGYLYSYEIGAYPTGRVAPWQQHFWVQSWGYVSDLEPFADMTTWNEVRDHLYKSVVGIHGPNGTENYCYSQGSSYTIAVATDNNGDPATWFDSWGRVFQQTHGMANTSCGNSLAGSGGGEPSLASTGYWGNLLPALAYAVDHAAPGAAAGWSRITGASNWPAFRDSGFSDTPVWGIAPRDTASSAGGGGRKIQLR
jgi:hypothetical protein